MLYRATHLTRFHYEAPVLQSQSEARLTPRSFPGQILHESRIDFDPEPAVVEQRTDYFGNVVTSFGVFTTHDEFSATAVSIVEVEPRPYQMLPTISWEDARDRIAGQAEPDLLEPYEFVFDSRYAAAAPELAAYAEPTFSPGRPLIDAVGEFSHRIHAEFKYAPKSTEIDMPLLEVLSNKRGVCQDFAHIMIGALRSLRLPARYVSGYLRSGANYQGADASHAWVSVFIPGSGWFDFDPTNDVRPSEGHVTLGWGRDYGDVTPIKGIAMGGGEQEIDVAVRVEAINPPAFT